MVVGSPIVLNLIPGGVMPVIMINETDKGYQKEFLIYNGNAPYNVPANVSATIRGTKRDGLGVTEAATVTAGSNVVRITVTEQMTAVPGKNIFELVFVDTNGLRVATINFIMLVERSALNADTVISESDIAYSEQVLDRLQSVAAFKEQLDNQEIAKIQRFDTVAQMRANPDLKEGMYARTGGYYAVNDGGGALYRIYNTAPATYYETLTNGLYARLITEGTADVKQFGAKGDGVTNDTSAFINALANASVVTVPTGKYKITSQIEITNKHRLIAVGTVRILTTVSNNYAFYIHGNTDSDYQDTNTYYDSYKGVWFGGATGGITIINSGGTSANGILFGASSNPPDNISGANSIAKIANVGIQGYDNGIKITHFNNYLNTFERVHFESCGNCVVFGDTNTTKRNSGEMFKFFDCIFSTSNTAIRYASQGWESSFIGCSMDFCVIGIYDSNYNRIFFCNGHIEGIGKRSASDTTYGIVANQHEYTIIVFDNVVFDISGTNGTKLFYGETGNLVFGATYVSTTLKYPDTPNDAFLSDHYIEKEAVCRGQSGYRMYLSLDNNLIPDAKLTSATLGALSGNDITNQIRIYYKHGCTVEIVQGSMLSGQKAIRFKGDGNAPMTASVDVIIPVSAGKVYNTSFASYKHSAQNMSRYAKAIFYDKDGNQLSETSGYLYTPDFPPNDEMFFPLISKQVTAPAGSAYAKFRYTVGVSPDAAALAEGEYIDIQYMYCEEW